VRDADHNGDRFAAIVMGIVGSPEFQMQQPQNSAEKPSDKTAGNAAAPSLRPAS
jgi:hypothetical protein